MKRPLPVFASPRITHDDEICPTDLREHEERWSHMSRLAGSHKQDDTVLRLHRHNMSPLSLQSGIPPQLASRIIELHLGDANNLPEWLDVISTKFFNLQHLYIDKDDTTEAGRIRRLYILYRIPHLLTMNGRSVTELERSLARPNSPNGMIVGRYDWIPEETQVKHGDDVQVSLHGVVKRVPADMPEETGSHSQETNTIVRSRALIQYSRSLESAYRIMKVPSPSLLMTEDDEQSMSTTAFAAGLVICSRNPKYVAMGEETSAFRFHKIRSKNLDIDSTPHDERKPLEQTTEQIQLLDDTNDTTPPSSRPSTPETPLLPRMSPAQALSPFPRTFRSHSNDVAKDLPSPIAPRHRPPPVPGRPVTKKLQTNRVTERWKGKKLIARAAPSILDEDSTSEEGE